MKQIQLRPNMRLLLPNAMAAVGVRCANASIVSVCSRTARRWAAAGGLSAAADRLGDSEVLKRTPEV